MKRQLLVEILEIVQFPDFSVNLEDYGIRVKRNPTNKGLLAVKITRHKKKPDEEDDDKVNFCYLNIETILDHFAFDAEFVTIAEFLFSMSFLAKFGLS